MNKSITTADIKLPEMAPKTKSWDPSKIISTGNIEQFQKSKKDKGKGKK